MNRAHESDALPGPTREVPVGVDPFRDLSGVEADEVSPLDEGDAAFGHQAADVSDVDAKVIGEAGDVEQAVRAAGSSGSLS